MGGQEEYTAQARFGAITRRGIVCLNGGYSVAFFVKVVIITTMNSKQIIKQLETDGWSLRGVKGSHHIFTHPSKKGHISVPHPKQDLGIGLVHKLLKQAGLKIKGD